MRMNPLNNSVIANPELESLLQSFKTPQELEGPFLEYTLSTAIRLTSADEGGVLTVSENQTSMRIEKWVGSKVDEKNRILPMDGKPISVCARCAKTLTSQIVNDVLLDAAFVTVSDSPVRSQLAVPVSHLGLPIGVINVEAFKTGHFTEDHRLALSTFGQNVGPLWTLVMRANRDQRYHELAKSLKDITVSMLDDDPADTLEKILVEALRLTNSRLGGVCLMEADRDYLRVKPARGLECQTSKAPLIPKGTGLVWECIAEKRALNIADVKNRPSFHDLSAGDIQSQLCAPMVNESGEIIGALNVESDELNHFSLLDEEILGSFAKQAAIAVNLLKQKERFAAADALAALGSVTGHFTHRINNLVGSIRVRAKMLLGKLASDAPHLVQTVEDHILKPAQDTLVWVETHEKMVAIDEAPIVLLPLARQTLAKLSLPPNLVAEFDFEDERLSVKASEASLADGIRELVENIVKAGTATSVIVKGQKYAFGICLDIVDNGTTIPPAQAEHLFERGRTNSASGVGTGFGLWWIKTYMCKIGGELLYFERQPSGNIFRLLFPIINSTNTTP